MNLHPINRGDHSPLKPLSPLGALPVFQRPLIADGSWSVLLALSRALFGILDGKAERLRCTAWNYPDLQLPRHRESGKKTKDTSPSAQPGPGEPDSQVTFGSDCF